MIQTDNLFIATVTYYDPERKFGFAEGRGKKVFFHQSACREMDGTPEDPQLSNRHSDREPRWFKRCRSPESIVVNTTASPKGLKAVTWGFVPVRTWLEDLHHFKTLDYYNDGTVIVRYSRKLDGRHDRKSEGKLTALPQLLTLGDPWTLRVTYDAYDGFCGMYGESSGHVDLNLALDRAYPSKQLPYGRYALDVFLPDTNEWAHIVFYPAHGK